MLTRKMRKIKNEWIGVRACVYFKVKLINKREEERREFFISFIKCIMNCVRSYRWRRLRALYLNSALVAGACFMEIQELVLTNHGAYISLNILLLIYIISSVMHAFWLVLTYDLLEDRRIDDVIIKTVFNSLVSKTNRQLCYSLSKICFTTG